jgi:hypothetical protein
MNFCDPLREKILWLLQTSPNYQESLKAICTLRVPRMLFLDKYKSLPPIEAFEKEDKDGWKKFVNEIFPRTPPQFRLEAVKIIYTVGVLTN